MARIVFRAMTAKAALDHMKSKIQLPLLLCRLQDKNLNRQQPSLETKKF